MGERRFASPWTRREFLGASLGCAAHVALALAGGSAVTRRAFGATSSHSKIVAEEPWGRLERIADGVWALVSTPVPGSRDPRVRRTLSNGGIIAGRDAVLAVEGLFTTEGAAWLSDAALELTGRRPTHVVLTHYHADHANGTAGYRHGAEPLEVWATAETRRLLLEGELRATADVERPLRGLLLPDARIAAGPEPTTIDLGGRVVRIHSYSGHTSSDVIVELEDPHVVWCGDLVWNGMVPNYVDAIPTRLGTSVRALLERRATVYVPGHGGAADAAGLGPYVSLLDDVEAAARRAIEQGIPAAQAAESYRPPAALGEWVMFSPAYWRVAFEAWERELRPSP
jgi:glyoxylase-like metal-dependent hydrolase (beta-lactamase superfamily II)